jgi:F-type H+-transporting ATPase subunit b
MKQITWLVAGLFFLLGSLDLVLAHGEDPHSHLPPQVQAVLQELSENKEIHPPDSYAEPHGHDDQHHPSVTKEKLLDLLWRALNFAALVFILVKFLGKPLAKGLQNRRQGIEEELHALQSKRDQAEESYREFTARLAGIEGEIQQILNRAKGLADTESQRILLEAEETAQEIKRQAEASIEAAAQAAQKTLQEEVAEQAAILAEQILIERLNAEDQAQIIEQYLDKVGVRQ